jgi:hypothetical protein
MWAAVIFFLILSLPYQGLIPTLDGRHDILHALGLSLDASYYPPLKTLLLQGFVILFGPYSYTWMGLILGVVGIVGIYLLTKLLIKDEKSAIVSSLLLAVSGLYLSNSLFSTYDFIVTIFVLYSFIFYFQKKLTWYIIVASLGVYVKETFLVLPFSILLVSILQRKLRWQYFFPFIAFFFWVGALHFFDLSLWNDANFSEFREYGSIGTILMNIITFKIFNQYSFASWLQMFILNFNWFFWLIAFIQLIFIKWNRKDLWFYSPIIVFVFLYVFLVVSFPTWSIPRYVLPVLPFLYIFIAAHLWKKRLVLGLTFFISIISLFHSVDPVSHYFYKEQEILGQKFYQVPNSGYDGITYNMQYFLYTKRVNEEYYKEEVKDCFIIFRGMKDDPELRSIYHFPVKPCQ